VDGASGGFVAPFLQPELEWDFRVPRVASINASGHKYGLVYPGVGWVMWRTPDALPDDLVFRVNYLGGEMPTFALNFSRPGAQVAAQYYNFIRLGRQGYQRVQHACRDVALHLSAGIAKMGPFELLTEGRDLPVFAFKLRDDITGYSVFDVSERLRLRGWQVPAYTFPADLTDTAVMRIVIRNGSAWTWPTCYSLTCASTSRYWSTTRRRSRRRRSSTCASRSSTEPAGTLVGPVPGHGGAPDRPGPPPPC